jgi:ribonuclease Y
MTDVLMALAGAFGGGLIAYGIARSRHAAAEAAKGDEHQRLVQKAQTRASQIEADAEKRSATAQREARQTAEADLKGRRQELSRTEGRLEKREANLDTREERLDKRIEEIDRRDGSLRSKEEQAETLNRDYQERLEDAHRSLERISGLGKEQARDELLAHVRAESELEAVRLSTEIEEEARDDAERKAKWITGIAIQRYAGEFVIERTAAVVHLPSDDIKGRIIGREGRNIRAIEAATGCDIIIDDTPETVVVSCFNPVRREVGRMTLDRLIADGRIHPSRVEDTVKQCEAEIEEEIRKAGERAIAELDQERMHPEIVKLLGRLKYRYSYAQNVWIHSVEVGFLCGLMAGELGLDVNLARRAGLLHDIGKAVDHEVEGGHAVIGGKIAKRYGERPEVVNAVAGHHDDVPAEFVYTHLATAADALSGARPGARRETLSSYVQRLEDLEALASAFNGVDKSYALQAGREVRVIVEGSRLDDTQAVKLSRDIARKIEDEMTYPGQIKVCVIRETRAIEFAK